MSMCERALVLAPLCSWIELIWTEWLTEKHIAKSMQWQINNTPLSPHETNGSIGTTQSCFSVRIKMDSFEVEREKSCGKTRGNRRWSLLMLNFIVFVAESRRSPGKVKRYRNRNNGYMKNWNPFQPSSQTNKLNACILHIAREKNWN